MPDIKTPITKRENVSKLSHFMKFSGGPFICNALKINNDNKNLFRDDKLNKIINKNSNANDIDAQTTQSISNSTKNQTSSKNNIINDDILKFEVGLVSAGTTSNNKIMIPILKAKSPKNNEGNGLDSYFKINLNKGEKNNNRKEKLEEYEYMDITHNSRNKLNIKREVKKKISLSMKNKEIVNIISGVQKLIPNFHKIKIEKGMIKNSKIMDLISKKPSTEHRRNDNNNNNYYQNNIFKSIDY